MREACALVGRHLRAMVRGRGGRIALLAMLLALGAVLLLARGDGATRSTVTLACFLVIGVLAFGTAAWSGALLPGDRAEGREVWLASLAPPGATRRLSAALAGMVLAVSVAVAGAALLSGILPAILPSAAVRASHDLDLPAQRRVGGGRKAVNRVTLELGEAVAPGASLGLVVTPLYFGLGDEDPADAARQPLRLAWTIRGDGEPDEGEATLPRGAPIDIALPAGARSIELRSLGPRVDVVLREARLLGGPQSLLLTLLLAGLVLGVTAAAVAPVAVAVSRWTSAPTATAAALVLAIAGGLRFLLPDLALPDAGPWHELGLEVVGAAAHLAPDLEALGLLGEPAAGRALALARLDALLPLLAYAFVALVIVAIPTKAEPARERTS